MYNSECSFNVYVSFRVFFVRKDKKYPERLFSILQEEIITILSSFCGACLSLFFVSKFAGVIYFQDLFFTLTGLSCFRKPYPGTVWYFAMLILFYFVTPFINRIEWGRKCSY